MGGNSRTNSSQNGSGTVFRTIPINTGSDGDSRNYLPEDDQSEIIHHNYYSLGYNEKYEVPNWVAYKLTEESLRIKKCPKS